jgi:hypothetical protein
MKQAAKSETDFHNFACTKEQREEWFAESAELAAAAGGLKPGPDQCIAFKTPIIFAEGAAADNTYVGSVYEQVSFLGDLNRQLSQLPDGSKVQLRTQE